MNAFKFLILLVSIFCFTQKSFAQETQYPETVVIKVVEFHDPTWFRRSKMFTVDQYNNVEMKKLEKGRLFWVRAEEAVKSNMIKVRQELQKWHNNGFSVKSSSTSTYRRRASLTMIVLQKN